MKPISPVLPSQPNFKEVVFAKDQPEYIPLPAVRIPGPDGTVITRWHLSWRERLRVLFCGDIWLSLMTFNNPFHPIILEVREPFKIHPEWPEPPGRDVAITAPEPPAPKRFIRG